MKYKTLVRLVLRLMGVWFIFTALSETALLLPTVTSWAVGLGTLWGGWWEASQVFGAITKLAIGLYLFFGGRWIIDRLIPSNRPYCHECGYELSGLAADGTCPECGTLFRR